MIVMVSAESADFPVTESADLTTESADLATELVDLVVKTAEGSVDWLCVCIIPVSGNATAQGGMECWTEVNFISALSAAEAAAALVSSGRDTELTVTADDDTAKDAVTFAMEGVILNVVCITLATDVTTTDDGVVIDVTFVTHVVVAATNEVTKSESPTSCDTPFSTISCAM